jgi:hypothetical protein
MGTHVGFMMTKGWATHGASFSLPVCILVCKPAGMKEGNFKVMQRNVW